jgi:hypothetical protein
LRIVNVSVCVSENTRAGRFARQIPLSHVTGITSARERWTNA